MWKWLIVIALVLFCGCATLTPEQQATIDKLEADITLTSRQVERIYNLQADVRQQYKDGQITAEKAVVWLAQLQVEGKQASANLQKLLTDYKNLKEQGVPWYHQVWAVVSSILAVYLGKKSFGLSSAIGLLTNSIEKGGDQKAIKARIARAGNKVVNAAAAKVS